MINVRKKLEAINLQINTYPLKTQGLLSGKLGTFLFKYKYFKLFNNAELLDQLFEEITESIYSDINISDESFCEGSSGKNCFYNYLFSEKIITSEDLDLITTDFESMIQKAENQILLGNYDFLYGASGYLHSYICHNEISYAKEYYFKLKDIFTPYIDKCKVSNHYPYFDSVKGHHLSPIKTDLSLAHGISGLLKANLDLLSLDTTYKPLINNCNNIIDYILEHQFTTPTESYFPNFIYSDKIDVESSRLAWCYGDLGIAIILLFASIQLKSSYLKEKAIDILEFNSKRRSPDNTRVKDISLCHGSAGIMHIFNKAYLLTLEPKFKEAADYWFDETMKFGTYTDTISGFKSFHNPINSFVQDNSILLGVSGVGLALLSHLTHDTSWDFCIQLNFTHHEI